MTLTRIQKVQERLSSWGIDALIVSDTKDLLYLTGKDLSTGFLCIFPNASHLLVDGRYMEACKGLSNIQVELVSSQRKKELLSSAKIIGFDSDATTYSSYEILSQVTSSSLKPLIGPIEDIRMIKEQEELQKIRASCKLCSSGFDFLLTRIREGVTEKTLAKEFEIFCLEKGADSLSFPPIIAFGENGAMPHYRAGNRLLQKNEAILIDIGVVLNGYNSDMTRMVYFGTPPQEIQKICSIVINSQQAALQVCKAGISSSELYLISQEVISQAGYKEFYMHGLGHGLGLDIHEKPLLKKAEGVPEIKLTASMVITIEPGIYLPHIGGVRIEDTVIVTDAGCENLTLRVPNPVTI